MKRKKFVIDKRKLSLVPCPTCGKLCKGFLGLATHLRIVHKYDAKKIKKINNKIKKERDKSIGEKPTWKGDKESPWTQKVVDVNNESSTIIEVPILLRVHLSCVELVARDS